MRNNAHLGCAVFCEHLQRVGGEGNQPETPPLPSLFVPSTLQLLPGSCRHHTYEDVTFPLNILCDKLLFRDHNLLLGKCYLCQLMKKYY